VHVTHIFTCHTHNSIPIQITADIVSSQTATEQQKIYTDWLSAFRHLSQKFSSEKVRQAANIPIKFQVQQV